MAVKTHLIFCTFFLLLVTSVHEIFFFLLPFQKQEHISKLILFKSNSILNAWSNYEHFFAVHLVRVAPFVFISVTTQQSILFTLRHRGTNLGLPQHNGSCRAFTDGLFCSDSTFFISAQKQKKNNNKSPNVTIFPLSSLWLHVRHWGDKHSGTCCCCVKDTLYRLIPLTCA